MHSSNLNKLVKYEVGIVLPSARIKTLLRKAGFSEGCSVECQFASQGERDKFSFHEFSTFSFI